MPPPAPARRGRDRTATASARIAWPTKAESRIRNGATTLGTMWRSTMRAWPKPERARRIDIGHLAHRERARPHHAAAAGNQRNGDGDDDVEHAGAEHRHHRQRQDDQRKRHQHVEHALEDEVEPAAEIGDWRRPAPGRSARRRWRRRSPRSCAVRAPNTRREKMSRPNWSVPSRCTQLGACIMAVKSFSSGSNGAIQSANTPAAMMTSTITRPMVPSGLRRQKSSAARAACACVRAASSAAGGQRRPGWGR